MIDGSHEGGVDVSEKKPRARSQSKLNRAHLQKFIKNHPNFKARGFSNIGESVYRRLERDMEKSIERHLHTAPSRKTLEFD